MSVLSIDFETRSTCDLKAAGADRYAADPTTDVWCMAWALDDDPIEIWYPGQPPPHKVLHHIENGGTVSAWNVAFELAIWAHVILRDYPDWPAIKIEQVDDTMARAYASSLPGALDKCADAVKLPIKKDMAGRRLMLKMCVPIKEWREAPVGPPIWHDVTADLHRLGEYCKRDVEVERELRKRIDPLSPRERAVWLMDRAINQRGVHVDVLAVRAALEIVEKEKRRLSKLARTVSDGAVRSLSSNKQIIEWAATKNFTLENLKKRRVSRLLRSTTVIPDDVREILKLRLEFNKASNAKLKAMLASRDIDGACRGLFSYHVATTGRWAGRRIQLQNLMRPEFDGIHEDKLQDVIEECIELFQIPDGIEVVRICFADPMLAVASCMRGMIVPQEGHEFIGGDFTGIENRVLMWLAGEEWMIEEFIKFDRGEGVDNYKLTFSKAFGIPIEEVTKPQRLLGKVGSLSCGFAGAVGAYLGMGDNYDMVPADVAKAAKASTSKLVWEATAETYPKEEKWRFGLDIETWTGIKCVVNAWRKAHPNVTEFWWDLQDCALAAVERPKTVTVNKTGKLKFAATNSFLLCMLPSGRCLHYPRPSVVEEKFGKDKNGNDKYRRQVKFWGLGKKSKKWEQRTLTPQILSENVTSGTARDVLVDAMLRAEARNYPIVMHVHDEIVTQKKIGTGDLAEFQSIMCDSAPWLNGLPVASKVEKGKRFWK